MWNADKELTMRSTTVCRCSGFTTLLLVAGAWAWATHVSAPATLVWLDGDLAGASRLIDQPHNVGPAPAPPSQGKKLDKTAPGKDGKVAPASDLRREQFRRQVEFANRRQQMLERIWREASRHEPSSQERSHQSVKTAFRDTVATARKATVKVLADGKQVALGAVVRADGLIATKGSEVRGKLECELADGRRLPADKVAEDNANDLVLLQVAASSLPAVSLDSSDSPAVGCWLATCGTGVDPVAVGVVSVAAREIRPPRGILGVLLVDGEGGARIEEVVPDSAADEAGLVVGDRLVEINKKSVRGHDDAVKVLRPMQAGDKVQLKIARGNEQIEMKVTLGSLEMSGMRADRFHMMNMLGGPLSNRRAGFASAIQHDTVLAPQDCGGPVVDLEGHVVALNIARAGRIESYAIPASTVARLVKSQTTAAKAQAVSLPTKEEKKTAK
jgi:serine protease Do